MKQTGYALEDSQGRIHAGSFSETASEGWSTEAFDYMRTGLGYDLPWKDWKAARNRARGFGYSLVRVRLEKFGRKAKRS